MLMAEETQDYLRRDRIWYRKIPPRAQNWQEALGEMPMSLLFVLYIYLLYSHFTSCNLRSLCHTTRESNFTNPIGRSVVCLSTSRGQVGTCRCRMFTEANLSNCSSFSHLRPAVFDCPTFPLAQISYFSIQMFAE